MKTKMAVILGIALLLLLAACNKADRGNVLTGNVVGVKKTTKATPIQPFEEFKFVSCKDSDGGVNAEMFGIVETVLNDGKVVKYEDSCLGSFLVEYYCSGNDVLNKNIPCTNCLGGVCA